MEYQNIQRKSILTKVSEIVKAIFGLCLWLITRQNLQIQYVLKVLKKES